MTHADLGLAHPRNCYEHVVARCELLMPNALAPGAVLARLVLKRGQAHSYPFDNMADRYWSKPYGWALVEYAPTMTEGDL